MKQNDLYGQAVGLVEQSVTILITSHARPDGDSCGCMLALQDALTGLGKKVTILLLSELPRWYAFLFAEMPPVLGKDVTIEQIRTGALIKPDLIIIVDTSSYAQLPDFEQFLKQTDTPILVIDHHIASDKIGAVEIIDPKAAAAGLVLFDFFKYAGWPMTTEAARFLFIAIATDTGWFRFANTDARVFRVCAELIEKGTGPSAVYRSLYHNFSYERFQLMLRMLNSFELEFDGRYAHQHITLQDFEQTGTSRADTESFIDEFRRIPSVEVAALFVESENGQIRCSMRSTGSVDVRAIMQEFGGGGHPMAAASTLPGPLEDAERRVRDVVSLHVQ